MTTRRSGAGVAVLGGDRLYAVRRRSGLQQQLGRNAAMLLMHQPVFACRERPALRAPHAQGSLLLLSPPAAAQVGGVNGFTWLNTAEVYNPDTNTWVRKQRRSRARAPPLSSLVCLLGNFNGQFSDCACASSVPLAVFRFARRPSLPCPRAGAECPWAHSSRRTERGKGGQGRCSSPLCSFPPSSSALLVESSCHHQFLQIFPLAVHT